jgi:thiamine biosynthesis protein ThiI
MQKIILLKYGELSTKKDNRNFFIKTLNNNIEKVLGNEVNIKYDFGRMFIMPIKDNYEEIIEKLKNVFGIHEIIIAYLSNEKELDNIKDNLFKLLKDRIFTSFKVEVKRSDKSYPLDSMELRKIFGAHILKNIKNIKVDVNNPDIIINVEIRNKETIIYFDSIKGSGGYPVSSLGKGLLMLSGGIDSPVAGYMAIKRGIKLEAVYFESPPHTSLEALNKVKELAKILAIYNNDIKLHIIHFTDIQEAIYKNIPNDYLITIMRRMMYRISAILCSRINAKAIINGESIGQVASQTLTSMSAINEVVNIPVIRPLACFDKLEIIDLSKKIGAYDTSILPYEDCCTIFVPDHPVINPIKEKCREYEKLIPYEDLIYECIKSKKTITISNKETKEFEDLL